MRLTTLTLTGAALTLGCSQDANRGPQELRETGYLACRADTAGCGEERVRCDSAGGVSDCVDRPAGCPEAPSCACAGETLCGDVQCRDVEGGLLCGNVVLDAERGDAQPSPVDARVADASQDALPSPFDAVRPDAYICDLALPELALSLSPLPAEATGGDLVSRTLAPDTLTLTVRTRTGAEETYTLTGPFAALPEEALPLGSHVNIQANGGAFVLRAGPCDSAPLEVISGTWPELEPLIGPVTPPRAAARATRAQPAQRWTRCSLTSPTGSSTAAPRTRTWPRAWKASPCRGATPQPAPAARRMPAGPRST